MNTRKFFFLLFAAIMPITMTAQDNNNGVRAKVKKLFTLDDLIPGGSSFWQSSYPQRRQTALWGDKCIELDVDECRLVDKEDPRGSGSRLFPKDQINQALSEVDMKVNHLYYAEFPYPDQTLVLLKSNTRQALVDWTAGKVVWSQDLGGETQASSWNKQSRRLAYVKGHNLYVTDESNRKRQLTDDGSKDLVYGQSVHRDEFGIDGGLFWSKDGSRLAFYKMDQSMVSPFPQVNLNLDYVAGEKSEENPYGTRCALPAPDRYPMAGETSHKVYVGVYDVATQKTIYLNAGDPTDRYFTNIAWSPDSKTIYVIELDRSQKHGKLDAYDAVSGQLLGTLFTEDNDKYFEPLNPIEFLPWDASRFVYQTRRDGYNHIYLYRLKGTKAELDRQLTSGQFEVISVLGFNSKQKTVVFTSNEADPIGCALYAVDMKGNRRAMGDCEGWHNVKLSDDGTTAVDVWAMPEGEVACRQDIVSTADGVRTTISDAQDPWDRFKVPEIKLGTIKAADGKTDVYYRLILPTDFDPQKKYPAVVYVYGGPHAHNIDATRHYGARGWDIWMAQNGYVMFCLDNRGSEHRGLEFEQATFRHLGVEEMKDQIRGVDFLKSLPYVDADRIGVHGWSFGGFMTTNLMTTYPEVFKVGVAGGPVIDWKYYEVMYGERYMETPQKNPDGYRDCSLLPKAKNLKGRLLIIYGGNDPICVPQHTLSFIRACIDANTYPDLFTYPGDEHNMMGTDRVHLHRKITQYFDDFLK